MYTTIPDCLPSARLLLIAMILRRRAPISRRRRFSVLLLHTGGWHSPTVRSGFSILFVPSSGADIPAERWQGPVSLPIPSLFCRLPVSIGRGRGLAGLMPKHMLTPIFSFS